MGIPSGVPDGYVVVFPGLSLATNWYWNVPFCVPSSEAASVPIG